MFSFQDLWSPANAIPLFSREVTYHIATGGTARTARVMRANRMYLQYAVAMLRSFLSRDEERCKAGKYHTV
jgi:hypothetical protein